MLRRLRYIAQPFWAGRPGEPYGFHTAVNAEEGGRILASQADGVLVYQQWVDDDAETLSDPDILAVLGDVPKGALYIDDYGVDCQVSDAA